MSSRAEYFISLANESSGWAYFNVIATGLCLGVFVVVLVMLALRRPERDQALANLPLDD